MKTRQHNSRRGIALILVLGMLGLMLIMATAFSVMMRTEHAGAGNFADEIRSKHVVWAALADAISTIETNMPADAIYPPWTGLAPQGVDVSEHSGTAQVNVVWGKAGDYVPGALYSFAENAYSDWVVDTATGTRYSYLVLNCSGLLDGNYAGGSNRLAGTHPQELYIESLPDVRSAADLIRQRDRDGRYETLPEFNIQQEGQGLAGAYSDHFVIGSYYPRGWWNGTHGSQIDTNQLYIGGDPTSIDRNQFKAKLAAACGSDIDGDFVYEQLIDYLDEDSKPEDLNSAKTELVPMFNEVVVDGEIRLRSANVFEARFLARTEWVFPFLKPSPYGFEIKRDVTVSVTTNGVAVPAGEILTMGDGVSVFPCINYRAGSDVDKIGVEAESDADHGIRVQFPGAAGVEFEIEVELKLQMLIAGDLAPVDEVPSPWAVNDGLTFRLTTPTGSLPNGNEALQESALEVTDPRFNWDAATWVGAGGRYFGSSLGLPNGSTTNFFAERATRQPRDSDGLMHVSDAGELRSVGELGNLLRNRDNRARSYFNTIRLFPVTNAVPDQLFRYFTVRAQSDAPGSVNANTSFTNVLETVFLNTPIGYPESTRRLAPTDDAFIEIMQKMTSTVFTNASDIQFFPWRSMLPSPQWRDVERESVIAYTVGLLGARQNLFTILLMGGPATQGMGLTGSQEQGWFGMRRAVAVVWRDPIPIEGTDSPPRHRYVLRYFNWLDE